MDKALLVGFENTLLGVFLVKDNSIVRAILLKDFDKYPIETTSILTPPNNRNIDELFNEFIAELSKEPDFESNYREVDPKEISTVGLIFIDKE